MAYLDLNDRRIFSTNEFGRHPRISLSRTKESKADKPSPAAVPSPPPPKASIIRPPPVKKENLATEPGSFPSIVSFDTAIWYSLIISVSLAISLSQSRNFRDLSITLRASEKDISPLLKACQKGRASSNANFSKADICSSDFIAL
jgi:hypothetical protein